MGIPVCLHFPDSKSKEITLKYEAQCSVIQSLRSTESSCTQMKRKMQRYAFVCMICIYTKCKDSHIMHKKYVHRAREVASWVKVFIAQADDLSSIPRINMGKERSGHPLTPDMCHSTNTHTNKQMFKKSLKNYIHIFF